MSVYGYEQHVRRTLTHMVTAYSVSGNVVRERTLICVILYGFFPVIEGLSSAATINRCLADLSSGLSILCRDGVGCHGLTVSASRRAPMPGRSY